MPSMIKCRIGLRRLVIGAVLFAGLGVSAGASVRELVVTNDLLLPEGIELGSRLIVRTSYVTIDGNGATLVGSGKVGEPESIEGAGVGVLIEGVVGVTLKNIRAKGFATGLGVRQAQGVVITNCDFSDNYHNPRFGWGEMPPRGGVVCQRASSCVFERNRANRVWDGIYLTDSNDNLIADNDFSECSNTCAQLWKSSRNKFLRNNLSYGIRIDRAAGEVHARDSTCVLIETGSNENYWFGNDITHGGDGVFIRPLNRWVSRGNVFVENDTSFANNNCVESWSPGNVFIRNKANHGSYGFWLGGSDQTTLIGNEAGFNGLTNGYHNAPEPGFSHGGIVVVGGPGSHLLIEGNYVHDNNGAGIAFRGDVGSHGRNWRIEHWVLQENRIANNRFGIWGRWGNAILVAGNAFTNNLQDRAIADVSDLYELPLESQSRGIPVAVLEGPERGWTGELIRFDASGSRDPQGHSLSYHWWLNGDASHAGVMERTFAKPGFYRVGLTVDNGGLAALAWRDLLITERVKEELGTEGQATRWGYELESDDGRGRMHFENDPNGLIGSQCLRFSPNPYPGAYATAIYPGSRDAHWDFSRKKEIRFWIRTENPNIPGWQNTGPVVRLLYTAS